MGGRARNSLWFRLGQFVGGVARGVKTPIEPAPRSRVVRHDVEEQTVRDKGAAITLRRTTIEEIEVRPDRRPHQRPDQPHHEGGSA